MVKKIVLVSLTIRRWQLYQALRLRSKQKISYLYSYIVLGCSVGRNTKFLLTLINNKWPPGIDPGGHHFVVLNVFINKKRFFVSAVVIYEKIFCAKG